MRYLILLFMHVSFLWGQGGALCSIALRVVDSEGHPVPYRMLSFRSRAGSEFVPEFVNLRGRVPCTVIPYTFAVGRTDLSNSYANIVGTVEVGDPGNSLTVVTNPNLVLVGNTAGEVSRALPVGYVWNGHVAPVPEGRLWVYIRSAVGSSLTEAEVDANGDFRIYRGFSKGPHLLYVMNEEGNVVYTTTLNITAFAPREDLGIKISPKPPVVILVR